MELNDAINSIFEGNSLLFTGSGFSTSAKNLSNTPFKTADKLAELLYNECGETSDEDLENAVDIFLDIKGEQKLIELLINEFTVSFIPDEMDIFGQLNWKRIYTTNYDDVIEKIYLKAGKSIIPVTLTQRPVDKTRQNVCVHLNGSINNLTVNTLNTEFRLTSVSYLTQTFLASDWLSMFSMDLATADSVFFVGFSMKYDLDIKRVVYANPELRQKTFFITSKNTELKNIRLLSKFGNPVPIGLSHFSKLISSAKLNYIPITRLEHYFSFKKIVNDPKQLLPVIKDSDILNLFINGLISEDLVQASIQLPKKYPYFIYRSRFNAIEEQILAGEKNFILHSDMGNGKTLFLNGLKFFLLQKGYVVYEYYKYLAPIYRELETICKNSVAKTVLIIDNYTFDWKLLEILKLHRDNLILVSTDRSLIYDVTADKLESLIGKFSVYDINYLDSSEIDILIDIFDQYGFWQEYSSNSKAVKRRFVEVTCNRELRLLLLKILNSPDILKRFENIISDIKGKRGFYDTLIFILISNVYGFELDLENLAYTLGYDLINSSSFQKNTQIKELIDIEKGVIVVKSSILSTVILSKIVDSYILVDTLLKIFNNLDKQILHKPSKNILKSLVSFSNLQRILDKSDRSYKYNMLRYFEGIRNTHFCQKNPYFWLQYAIEKLSERDYFTAKTYFDTAYAYGNSIAGFDSYQIDNHFARYILEFAIESGTKDDCMEDFLRAHKILMDPLHEKVVQFYPFRVAQNYLPFYQKFYDQLAASEKIVFVKSCEEILIKIDRFINNVPRLQHSQVVVKAKINLGLIIKETSS